MGEKENETGRRTVSMVTIYNIPKKIIFVNYNRIYNEYTPIKEF